MKFMLILKATKESEAGKMPSEESIAAMVSTTKSRPKREFCSMRQVCTPVPEARESDSRPTERKR